MGIISSVLLLLELLSQFSVGGVSPATVWISVHSFKLHVGENDYKWLLIMVSLILPLLTVP